MREKKVVLAVCGLLRKMYLLPGYTINCCFFNCNLLKNQSDFYYLYTWHLYLKHLNKIGYFKK